jgi:hypothetical protein
LVALLSGTNSFALTIAPAGTEGIRVIADGNEILLTYLGSGADYTNNLYLTNTGAWLFGNRSSQLGSQINIGTFTVGTELVFRLNWSWKRNSGNWYSGDASRNEDSLPHARVQANWQDNVQLVSFEDLYGLPEGAAGFNDFSFSVTSLRPVPVPEPGAHILLAAGLVLLPALRKATCRRRTDA